MYILVLTPSTRKPCHHIYNFAGDFIYANSKQSPRNNVVCDKMAIYLLTSSLNINLLVNISTISMIFAPLYKKFAQNENELFIKIVLPFVDPETPNGYVINMISQSITCVFGSIVIPAIELVTCVLKNNISAIAAVVSNDINEFGNYSEVNSNYSVRHTQLITNIILKIDDYNRFNCSIVLCQYFSFFIVTNFSFSKWKQIQSQVLDGPRRSILLEIFPTTHSLDVLGFSVHFRIFSCKLKDMIIHSVFFYWSTNTKHHF